MTDINPKLATDLDAVKLREQQEREKKEALAELEAQKRQNLLEQQAKAWERSMKRAFKGIFRHKDRKVFLMNDSMGRAPE
jgi:hypothetical protein